MDIKSISTITLPDAKTYQKTLTSVPSNANISSHDDISAPKKSVKALPYVAAGIVLAGLGIYASRNKIAKLFNKENVKQLEGLKEDLKEEILNIEKSKPEVLSTVSSEIKSYEELCRKNKVQNVCIGFADGKPIYAQIEIIPHNKIAPAQSAFSKALKSVNLKNPKLISKIETVKAQQKSEIDKIISDNTQNGHVNLNIMNKVARDFSNDEKGRGADRFHQAAEVFEQSLIKEFLKGDKKELTGLQNIFDIASQNSPLFEIYTKIPLEEAASRLRYLADNDLRSASYKGMDAESFFQKSFSRLVEKLQFQKYNEAHQGTVVKVGV